VSATNVVKGKSGRIVVGRKKKENAAAGKNGLLVEEDEFEKEPVK